MYNLLVVDDEEEALEYLVDLCSEITSHEIYVYKASSGEEALAVMQSVRLDVLLSDIRMPGMDGLELIQYARQETTHCKFILLTGYRNFDTVYRAIQTGDVRYLLKTESEEVIQQTVTEAIEELRTEMSNREALARVQKRLEKMHPFLQNDYLSGLIALCPSRSLTSSIWTNWRSLWMHHGPCSWRWDGWICPIPVQSPEYRRRCSLLNCLQKICPRDCGSIW